MKKKKKKEKKNNNGPGKDRTICMRSVGKGAMEEMKEKLTEGRVEGGDISGRTRGVLFHNVNAYNRMNLHAPMYVCMYVCSRGRIHPPGIPIPSG